jgi:hypothetical protein
VYVRITLESQQITTERLKLLKETLADEIEFKPCYKKNNGKIDTLYYWQETDDPEEAKKVDEKGKSKELVYKTDIVQIGSDKEYLCDMDYFLTKHPDIKIKLRGMPKSIEQNYNSIVQEIVAIQNKFEDALAKFDKQVQFNELVNVHVGGFALMSVNQVGFGSDMCTERVQDILNNGWRMLAVCVQPDGRRPDYIFGKYNPEITEGKIDCMKF